MSTTVQQALFPYEPSSPSASPSGGREKNGVVYTKSWVVELILDLSGYRPVEPLFEKLLIEPSAGDGSFLIPIAERLIQSCREHGQPIRKSEGSIVAFELDPASVEASRAVLTRKLLDWGISEGDARHLSTAWVRCADYLLESSEYGGRADFVVGNPPYIRLEDLWNGGAAYRSCYPTMVGRSDIYVAFYEAALRQLKPDGRCGFICADRWMFNQYGAALRRFITASFCVEAVIQMHHADAFDAEVSAYPAVTVVKRAKQGSVVVATLEPAAEQLGGCGLAKLFAGVRSSGKTVRSSGVNASRMEEWFEGNEPWPLMEPVKLGLLKRLEREFPTLESSGATVGIGVATGADKVFITENPDEVESDRLLPLAMAFDIKGGQLNWSGHYLVNPWNGSGLVDLSEYPRLSKYFNAHKESLCDRHVGKKNPSNWFRTIDRVSGPLTSKLKLYLPDIKGRIAPVLDRGETYPHHNLYFIASESWDLEVLGGLLLSNIAQFFVEAYGVRMRGGYLRFQAQYLRRIRVPRIDAVSSNQAEQLKEAFSRHDVDLANQVANELFRVTDLEVKALGHR